MTIETLRSFLLWCAVLNYAFLIFWVFLFRFAHDWMLRVNTSRYHVSTEQFYALNLAGILFYKMGIFFFNIVPCVVLWMSR